MFVYVYTTFALPTHSLTDTNSHNLTIVNNAAMNLGIQNLIRIVISFPSTLFPKDCWVIWQFYFQFLKSFLMFSIVAGSLSIPINSIQGFQYLHILVNTCFLLITVILTDVRIISQVLIWISLMISDTEVLLIFL